jgi:hypothetical protein
LRKLLSHPKEEETLNKGLIIGGIVGAIAIIFIGSWISTNNWAIRSESAIIAQKDTAKNVLGQYGPSLREALGVTKLQTKAVTDVITGANESRYGKTGSQASIQWIQEQNPTLDQSSYQRILNLIEAGRRDFRDAQTQQIDRIRDYRAGSQVFPASFFLGLAGKPTPGFFEKYDKIVVSSHADEAFKTGIDDGVDTGNIQ